MTTSNTKGTFEMLWDCAACGTKGLLGKSNRCCPGCGSPQDPKRRYFPPEGLEQAAVNHSFDGADWSCSACTTPNGANAACCRNCGNPKDGEKVVALKDTAIVGQGFAPPKDAGQKPMAARSRLGCMVGAAVVLAVVVTGALAFLWKKEVKVTVQGHRWTRAIAIESMAPRSKADWCDQMPGDAYSISRSREVRDHKQVPDGEECQLKNVDKGDGTFDRVQECRPKYRDEPIYGDKCSYQVDRWEKSRTATAEGAGLTSTPQWPATNITRPGACRGCEREGAREERYVVDLASAEAKYDCDVGAAAWKSYAVGAVVPLQVRMVGGADCASLSPPP